MQIFQSYSLVVGLYQAWFVLKTITTIHVFTISGRIISRQHGYPRSDFKKQKREAIKVVTTISALRLETQEGMQQLDVF